MSGVQQCDHCRDELHRGDDGAYVGMDGSSDCPASDTGHEVDGFVR